MFFVVTRWKNRKLNDDFLEIGYVKDYCTVAL